MAERLTRIWWLASWEVLAQVAGTAGTTLEAQSPCLDCLKISDSPVATVQRSQTRSSEHGSILDVRSLAQYLGSRLL